MRPLRMPSQLAGEGGAGEDIHDGSVATMTLPTPWYSPRKSAGRFTAPLAACRKRVR
jgi:hypothetical protein